MSEELILMLPEKKLTYINGILTLVDGKLNPCFFHSVPDNRSSEEKQKERQEKEARVQLFKETFKKLYHNAKRVTLTFKDGHIAVLELNDRDYDWRVKWSTRDLLKQAVIPKKLGFNEYGVFAHKARPASEEVLANE
jgi:hypothetical protein